MSFVRSTAKTLPCICANDLNICVCYEIPLHLHLSGLFVNVGQASLAFLIT